MHGDERLVFRVAFLAEHGFAGSVLFFLPGFDVHDGAGHGGAGHAVLVERGFAASAFEELAEAGCRRGWFLLWRVALLWLLAVLGLLELWRVLVVPCHDCCPFGFVSVVGLLVGCGR